MSNHDDEQKFNPFAPPSSQPPVPPATASAPEDEETTQQEAVDSGTAAPPAGQWQWAAQTKAEQHTAPTGETPPVPPFVPPSSSIWDTGNSGSSSASKRPILSWLTVVLVSALIGGLVGAYVAHDDREKVTSSLSNSSRSAATQSAASGVPATPESIRSVLQKVQPAVVSIVAETRSGESQGTGMIIQSDGLILTNNHVVEGATSISVTLDGEKSPRPVKLLGADRTIDAALLQLPNITGLPVVTFGQPSQTNVGDEVVAIGNALALPGGPTVTTGIVSAKDRSNTDEDGVTLTNLIQTDAAINPGNSGGPLANMAGEVIAMNTEVIRGENGEYENLGFAESVDIIKPAISDLQNGRSAQLAYLGVSTETVTPNIQQRNNLTPATGAVVAEIGEASPAAQAGLEEFDVITAIDGTEIATTEDLVAAVRAHKPGDKITIKYYRGSDQKTSEATLVLRPSSGG